MKVGNVHVGSTVAFVIYSIIMVGGFVWATFFLTAPYQTLAEFLTIGAAAYWGKRLLQKSAKLGGLSQSMQPNGAKETTPISGKGED